MSSADLPIYLDNNASTPCDPRVFEAMTPYFTEYFGNASSAHIYGKIARDAVEKSRKIIADAIGAQPDEIIFASGATEANNLAIKGSAEALKDRGRHIITAATEHKSILDSCAYLSAHNYETTVLPVDPDGFISLNDISGAMRDDTILIAIMHGNNETGVIQNIAEIGRICRERNIVFHTDATQTIGKIPFNVNEHNADSASMTAHKLYGPKGIGALYVRAGRKISPQIHGGGHEYGLRSGTLNAPAIIGFAKAVELSQIEMKRDIAHCRNLRDKLWLGVQSLGIKALLNGPDPIAMPDARLPGNLNASLAGNTGRLILDNLRDAAAFSSGSACDSAAKEFSHVLSAIGRDGYDSTAIRFGVGRFSTESEIELVLDRMRSVAR